MGDFRYLKQRRQGWYFQLAVPQRYRKALGKATITASLQTRDPTEAQKKRWAKFVETQELFAKLERRPPTAEPLDPQALLEIDKFAHASYRQLLATMVADARKGVRTWGKTELDVAHAELWRAYDERNFAPVAEPLTEYCAKHSITLGSELYIRAGLALLLAHDQAVIGRHRFLEGKPTADPETFLEDLVVDPLTLQPLHASSKRDGLIFAEVAARFIAERQRDRAFAFTEQTKEIYETAFRLFDSWANEPTLGSVDRYMAAQFVWTGRSGA